MFSSRILRHPHIALRTLLALSVAFALTSTPARAQEASEANRTVYDAAYFAPFSVFTAEDMLNRVPGIQELLTDAEAAVTAQTSNAAARRGFGSSGDQILINGRRLSGKANNIFSALQRIQANQVLRIEVIRGSVPDLDVRSDGILVNVVLLDTLVAGSGTWEGSLSRYTSDSIRPGTKLSYSADVGSLTYILGLTATPRFDFRNRVDLQNRPDGVLFQRQVEHQRIDANDITVTGGLTYAFINGDRANLNGRFADQGQDEFDYSDRTAVAGPQETYLGSFVTRRDLVFRSWEVGGDYEHTSTGGGVLKGLFVVSNSTQHDERAFDIELAGRPLRLDRIQLQEPDRGERILRATYRQRLAPEHTIEVGAEGAINILRQTIALTSNATGTLVNIPLFNDDAKIDEKRGETFASHTWQPRPGLQVESAVDTEYSRLRQRGDINEIDTFFYVKPRFDVRYDLTPQVQLRGRAQRTVSQLDFAGFLVGFLNDDTVTDAIRSGNPDLVPEKAWEFTIAAEKRLGGDQGLLSVEPFYYLISDRIERIPNITNTGQATGNIGRAHDYGVRFNAGLRLGWLGLQKGQFDLNASFRKSSVRDGFTLKKRVMQNTPARLVVASFRNDSGWRNLAYGATATYRSDQTSFDYDFLQIVHLKTTLDAFVEIQLVEGVTARLDGRRAMGRGAGRKRFNYQGSRFFDRLVSSEDRTGTFGNEYKFSLRGRF